MRRDVFFTPGDDLGYIYDAPLLALDTSGN
jgi:hypothetical protein